MSLESKNKYYESLYRESINEVSEDVYTPEYFEFGDEVGENDQMNLVFE